jgi:transcriptional regulator with XRE-family HTH domain
MTKMVCGQVLRREGQQMASFAQRLAEAREAAGLSQYALAKRSGVSKQALSLLELGQRQPSWETVQRLCLALGASYESLADKDITLPEVKPVKMGRPPKSPPGPGPANRRKGRK